MANQEVIFIPDVSMNTELPESASKPNLGFHEKTDTGNLGTMAFPNSMKPM